MIPDQACFHNLFYHSAKSSILHQLKKERKPVLIGENYWLSVLCLLIAANLQISLNKLCSCLCVICCNMSRTNSFRKGIGHIFENYRCFSKIILDQACFHNFFYHLARSTTLYQLKKKTSPVLKMQTVGSLSFDGSQFAKIA